MALLTFLTNSSSKFFLTTSLFPTSLNLLKSAGAVSNLSTSNLTTFGFKLAKSPL